MIPPSNSFSIFNMSYLYMFFFNTNCTTFFKKEKGFLEFYIFFLYDIDFVYTKYTSLKFQDFSVVKCLYTSIGNIW